MTATVVSPLPADTLDRALVAIAERDYFSAFPESPSPRVYGPDAAAEGEVDFRALLRRDFVIDQPGVRDHVATERSPFGVELGVRYPRSEPDALIAAARAAMPGWRDAGPDARAVACLAILSRLHQHIFQLANAVQFTTGQAFVMAFQAGGAHALDRALEAVAYAYTEQLRHPTVAAWTKPGGKGGPLRMEKTFHLVPRGVALVIGCNTFPTWNSYPGLFASLATGNPVIVKPHPGAVLPLALTVRYAREVLAELGYDPNLVTLAVEEPGEKIAATLAVRPEIKIIDYTGSTGFGNWLEANARQAVVYTEKAGVNTVIVDSTDDFAGMCRNIAFSLTLYSGQMCTTPQDILVPRDGIATESGPRTFAEVAQGIADAVAALVADDSSGVELTGAMVNDAIPGRIAAARGHGKILLDSRDVRHPSYPDAVVCTPLILTQDAARADNFDSEWFGPISFVVATDSTPASIELFRRIVGAKGALTAAVYSTSEETLDAVESAAMDVGVHLSANLTGGVFVNQSAAFSDFHGTGANAATNAALTDGAFVASRFRIVQSRRHL